MQILLIEDNQIEAELLRELLADAGHHFRVFHVQTLAEALDGLDRRTSPDVILLDLHLPDVLGLEGLRTLRARLPHTPILILTNAREPGLDERVLLEGAQDFLQKPRLSSQSLLQAIRKAVARQAFSGGLEADPAVLVAETGMLPRGVFVSVVGHAILRAARSGAGSRGAVAYLAAPPGQGDRMMDGLLARLRPGDACTLIADDVVGLLLSDVGTADQAAHVMQRLADSVSAVGQVHCGIAECDPESKVAQVLAAADQALGRAVQDSRLCCLADRVLDRQVAARAQTAAELSCALDRGELGLEYQPEVDLDSGRVTGFEALLRWNHPAQGQLPAASFIEVAEQSAVIDALNRFVLGTAVRQVRRWQTLFPVDPPLSISVNLSRRCFEQPGFAREVLELLRQEGLAANCLRLEVPGAGFATLGKSGRRERAELRSAGVVINVDGFDLSEEAVAAGLWQGEFDVVKIGREGFASLERVGTPAGELLESVLALGRALGLEFVAKGVETAEQASWLRDRGCPRAQGHWFAAAMPDDAVRALLSRAADSAPASEVLH